MNRSDETLGLLAAERAAFDRAQKAIENHQRGDFVIPILKLMQRYGSASRERALSEARDAIDAVPLS